ncbi:MAG: Protein translocase subunit SecE [Candidatus Dichloromethanomonas elyunquensis]|nr:MAG: Protein translocase subunit SecE [Candidatus Dichloromethanomonas elyunquensis]
MAVAKKVEGADGGLTSRFRNIGKRFNHFREVWNELKKVHWPTREQLLIYTGVVFVSVGIIALLIWVVDSGLTFAMNTLLGS